MLLILDKIVRKIAQVYNSYNYNNPTGGNTCVFAHVCAQDVSRKPYPDIKMRLPTTLKPHPETKMWFPIALKPHPETKMRFREIAKPLCGTVKRFRKTPKPLLGSENMLYNIKTKIHEK